MKRNRPPRRARPGENRAGEEPRVAEGERSAGSPSPPEQVLYLDTPPVLGEEVQVEGAEAQHARSLRLRTGDPVHVVDGRGGRYRGRVTALGKHGIRLRLDAEERLRVWPAREIWLGAGVLRSTRMDFLIEKASELGVTRLVPLLLQYCVARPHEDGAKQERWHRLAVESLKQSRRARLLEVTPPMGLEEFLGALPSPHALWVADPAGSAPAKAAMGVGTEALALVVGGSRSGTLVRVERLKEGTYTSPRMAIVRVDDETAEVPAEMLFMVGKEKPVLRVVR